MFHSIRGKVERKKVYPLQAEAIWTLALFTVELELWRCFWCEDAKLEVRETKSSGKEKLPGQGSFLGPGVRYKNFACFKPANIA